ncbi:MAG: orotidine-5'-phosphate decarboxylase [Gemmatimonadota bacterium]
MAEIILALDLPGQSEALKLLDRAPEVRWVKVGPILMTREGPELIRELVRRGLRVFLDLKWHDIPNTVVGAVEAARELGVSLATLHALGGADMMRAAAAAAGNQLSLVAVTVLTSHDAASYGTALGRDEVNVMEEVGRQAGNAIGAGLQGVVCSAREAALVRARIGKDSWIVVPGIRRAGDSAGDQIRTATPAEAVSAGATHLVVGRPILQATEPSAVFREMSDAAR